MSEVDTSADNIMSSMRPPKLKPIREEPDERRRSNSGDEFSSDDDSDGIIREMPQFDGFSPGSRIAFPQQTSFGKLMSTPFRPSDPPGTKANDSVLVDTPSGVSSGTSLPFLISPTPPPRAVKSVTEPKKMMPVPLKDSFDSASDESPSNSEALPMFDSLKTKTNDSRKPEVYNGFKPNPALAILEEPKRSDPDNLFETPDSTLSQNDTELPSDGIRERSPSLSKDLTEARKEIERLMEAIHIKDQRLLEAQDNLRRVTENGPGKRDSAQLQHMLAAALENANTLETKNVYLTKQIDTVTQENHSIMKNMQLLSRTLGVEGIPVEDPAFVHHLSARLENLLEKEKELENKQEINAGFELQELRSRNEAMQRSLSDMKDRLAQEDLINRTVVKNLNDEVGRLKQDLELAKRRNSTESEFVFSAVGEARQLSQELREAQMIIQQKDAEIAELQTIIGSQEALKIGTKVNALSEKDIGDYEMNSKIADLQTENERLKKMFPSLVNGSAAEVLQENGHNSSKSQLKRDLDVLNSALAQVIAASQKAIDLLRTENTSLRTKVAHFEKQELSLKGEITLKQSEIRSLERDLGEARSNLKATSGSGHTGSASVNGTKSPWTMTDQLPIHGLNEMLEQISAEKAATLHILSEQQNQIAALTQSLRDLESDLASRPGSAAFFGQTGTNQYDTTNDSHDTHKTQEGLHMDDLNRLQQLLIERERETAHWRRVYAEDSARLPMDMPASAPDILRGSLVRPAAQHSPKPQSIERVDTLETADTQNDAARDSTMKHLISENSRLLAMVEQFHAKLVNRIGTETNATVTPTLPQPNVFSSPYLQGVPIILDPNYSISGGLRTKPASSHSVSSSGKSTAEELRETRPKPELPSIDYEGMKRKSMAQMEQFQNLNCRLDKTIDRYASYLNSARIGRNGDPLTG